jgi:hypothetical protein
MPKTQKLSVVTLALCLLTLAPVMAGSLVSSASLPAEVTGI